jgi:hypothetical protein
MYASLSDYTSILIDNKKVKVVKVEQVQHPDNIDNIENIDIKHIEHIEHYTDIIAPHYFPPMYSFSSEPYSINTHRFSLDESIKPFHQPTDQFTYGDQEIVIVTIPNTDTKEFIFYTDCCKIDALSYLRQDSIEDGVAINGVFYQFHTDSVPLGGYKQDDTEIVRELQPV